MNCTACGNLIEQSGVCDSCIDEREEQDEKMRTLEARCAELEALVRGHEFTIAHQKIEIAFQSSLLERAEAEQWRSSAAKIKWLQYLERGFRNEDDTTTKA